MKFIKAPFFFQRGDEGAMEVKLTAPAALTLKQILPLYSALLFNFASALRWCRTCGEEWGGWGGVRLLRA